MLASLVLPSPAKTSGSFVGSPSSLLKSLADDLIGAFFRTLERWVATGTTWVLKQTWAALSATTEPVVTGTAFDSEYHVMVLIGVGTVVPLLGLATIQAVAQQDVSGLLRTALLRLPMAILLTGVVIEIVSLGLTATDRASSSLLATGGGPAGGMFTHLEEALGPVSGGAAAAFGGLLLVGVVAIISFVLWIELAVRSAAVAVAAMFLPLALAGLVWPATAHWARRLGETLAALVLMKLVMAAVLALAAGAIAAGSGGISGVVEGVALLGLTAFSPFALFRLVPMMEAGAVSHLEGVKPASTLKSQAWSLASAGAGLAAGGGGGTGAAAGAGSGTPVPPGPAASVYGKAGGSSGGSAGAGGGSGRAGTSGGTGAGSSGSGGGGDAGGSGGGAGGKGSPGAGRETPRGPIGQAGWEGRLRPPRTGGDDAGS
jgi:hypothetical protein